MFIVSLTYVCDLAKADEFMDAHIAYVDKYFAKKVFLASGRKVPRTGGVILMNADNLEAVQKIVEEDPFFKEGIASFDITEFAPTRTSPELSILKQYV